MEKIKPQVKYDVTRFHGSQYYEVFGAHNSVAPYNIGTWKNALYLTGSSLAWLLVIIYLISYC